MAQKKQCGIEETLGRWRDEVKNKQRRIITFEETVEIKINAIKNHIFKNEVPLDGWEYREFIYSRKRERNYISDWQPIRVGDTWGGPDRSALFRCRATMPKNFAGRKVALKIYFSGDGLLYVNGKPYHGLDPFRDTVILSECANGSEQYNLEAESYIFWHFGESEIKTFESSHFAVMDQEMHDTYWDFRAVYNVLTMPDINSELAAFIKAGLEQSIWQIDQNETDPKKFAQVARDARNILQREIYQTKRFMQDGLLHLCGNSHLDVVFLWTHAEFVRKLGRTHATTLRLMEQYPEYIFSQSQPLMYQEMKMNYPEMYEEVRKRIKEGQWEVIGATWVEPDCNLISGESMVRQLLHGISFIEQEFNVTPKTCWCPDVFGNTWTMPQILSKAGLEFFVTHKMGTWNDTNPWTKHNFIWRGPDGSEIFSVMPPTHFIGTIEPDHMAEHWKDFSDKDTIGESLYNYGWGDGGGGPDVEMLEYLKRYNHFPGVTPCKPNTIEGALESIRSRAKPGEVPVVNDELYLEEHRGVYTTKGRLKKLNRLCETLYFKAEMWSSFASLPYPQDRLDSGWKEILTNQFHDSLPGTHIPNVYVDLLESYGRTVATGENVLKEALNDLAQRVDCSGEGTPVVVFNSLQQLRTTLVKMEWSSTKEVHVLNSEGAPVPSQIIFDLESGRNILAFEAENLPGIGFAVYHVVKGKGPEFDHVEADERSLKNKFIDLRINENGEVVHLVNRQTDRKIFSDKHHGNVFKLYEDVPGKYEAWDIAPTYTKVEFDIGPAQVRLLEQGPVCATLEVTRAFKNTTMRQLIRLTRLGRRVDFHTHIDWHEQQKLLKVRFYTPFQTRTATYDIAYGNMERSCWRSNSFEEARFEVPAHWWMDLSQPDNGLSLLNDCKYGHEAHGGMMALTLLRGSIHPDPLSDQENHFFTYSLFPHSGDWRIGGTIQEASDLNNPVDIVTPSTSKTGSLGRSGSFLELNSCSVSLEAVKKAEQSDDLIVRIVERHGADSELTLRLNRPFQKATSCNLLEREDEELPCRSGEINIQIQPYEIRTFKLC